MSIKDNSQGPRNIRIGNILLLLAGIFLFINLVFPNLFGPQIPRVPYSLFIDQVEDGKVARASVGQEQIRYQLKGTEE
ncbi:hypothetical protein CYANOKiyG1_59030 [Okeania sp. KiyG1]|nr:hypothetical protein CYANOKiyG1_59030 [Okeania sp. KiyG1]